MNRPEQRLPMRRQSLRLRLQVLLASSMLLAMLLGVPRERLSISGANSETHPETPWKRSHPGPPNLVFLERNGKETRESSQKARVFLFAEPLKCLEKEGRTDNKSTENRKTNKTRQSRKKKLEGWRVRAEQNENFQVSYGWGSC